MSKITSSLSDRFLEYCATGDHKQAILALSNFSYLINIKNNLGQTPLHIACINNHPKIVISLIEFGHQTSPEDNSKLTPISSVCKKIFENMSRSESEVDDIGPYVEVIKMFFPKYLNRYSFDTLVDRESEIASSHGLTTKIIFDNLLKRTLVELYSVTSHQTTENPNRSPPSPNYFENVFDKPDEITRDILGDSEENSPFADTE